ncbi:hypothetical protein J6590_073078 [Homalodisca vitripennis]|nr:hypothetical protein J6590_073078 [Homalodisca vitripennis]
MELKYLENDKVLLLQRKSQEGRRDGFVSLHCELKSTNVCAEVNTSRLTRCVRG